MDKSDKISRRRFLQLGVGTIGAAIGGASVLSGCGGDAISVTPVIAPRLASASNFRDTAGSSDTGYLSASGMTMRKGVIYRSSALTLSAADLATVDTLGITQVYDLRMSPEIRSKPDVVPVGAVWQNLSVLGGVDLGVTPTTGATQTAFMFAMYRAFVTSETARANFRMLFVDLVNNNGNQVFHCTAGKDRSGWATAILHTILGIPQQTIFADYLLTNAYRTAEVATEIGLARQSGGQDAADMMAALQGAQPSYMQTAFDQVTASYGSMASYLENGLQIDQATLREIRQRMLV
ncbi:tyrosine-protein phosphatase [Burkholderia cepacia]|uniref:tyrosine-protein phosphatase n=1 Tax=Burkholderia cepacia TaxID=292 RepID=UPI002AB65AF1|nr:tyrosine-protein phosphatase [Burkholderia cepacia]